MDDGLVGDRSDFLESGDTLGRQTGRDEGFPGGELFLVRIHAGGADDKTQRREERSGPFGMIGESLGGAVGIEGRVGHVGEVRLDIKVATDRGASQGVAGRTSGSADAVVPDLLSFGRKDEFDEAMGELGTRRAAEETDGIGPDRGAAAGHHEFDAGFSGGGIAIQLVVAASVKVDAHADGGVAHRDIARNFGGGVGEVATVGTDAEDEAHGIVPASGDGGVTGESPLAGESLDALLHEHFKGLRGRARLRGIGEGDLAAIAWILEVAPFIGWGLEAEPGKRIAVVADSEGGENRPDPAVT